jgi:hydrogenase nickel incorporation protein HypA/HybF
MHELGLAHGILDIVREHVPLARAQDVRAVRVQLGPRANVVPESLDFCFGAIVVGTPYRQAFLTLEPGGQDLRVVDVELEESHERRQD